MMMIFVRVFYWVYLDVSGETSTEVQTVPDPQSQSAQCSQGVSPISISRLYQSTDFYGDNSVFKKRKNLSQNLPEINEEVEPQLNYEMSNQGMLSAICKNLFLNTWLSYFQSWPSDLRRWRSPARQSSLHPGPFCPLRQVQQHRLHRGGSQLRIEAWSLLFSDHKITAFKYAFCNLNWKFIGADLSVWLKFTMFFF